MGFSRHEYWNGLPCLSPGDLFNPGTEPGSPTLQADSLPSELPVLFSCSVVSDSLWPHELQHTRLPCPSPTPRACSHLCSSSWWCHPTISSSVIPVSSCLQSFPASGSFPMSQFSASGGQSTGTSTSVLPMNIQDWFSLGLTGLISFSPRDTQESSPTPQPGKPPRIRVGFKNWAQCALHGVFG